jgi:hypothetical protein
VAMDVRVPRSMVDSRRAGDALRLKDPEQLAARRTVKDKTSTAI